MMWFVALLVCIDFVVFVVARSNNLDDLAMSATRWAALGGFILAFARLFS
ncbi:hypothetical protein [Bradyrhizobium sp. 613_E4_N2_2]